MTYSKRTIEQHITLPKISLQCILNLIFSTCIHEGDFPTGWEKATAVLFHQPVSLPPICGKIFEFVPCINQLLCITHEISIF